MTRRALCPWLAAAALILALSQTAAAQDLERAQAAFREGRYAAALEHARRAADRAPNSLPALLARAGMAEFMGEFDEAGTFYAKAEALDKNQPETIYRTASFALRIGDHDRALQLLDRLLALHTLYVRTLFRWGPGFLQPSLRANSPVLEHVVQIEIDVLTEKGDLARARRMAKNYRIVEAGRDYCVEAQTKLRSADREETFRAFRLATLAQPDAVECIAVYGQWLAGEGYVTVGRRMIVEAMRLGGSFFTKEAGDRYLRLRLGGDRVIPKRAEQLFLIARQRYLRDGDVDGATRLFEQIIRLAPAFARPYDYRALIAWDAGDRDGAIAWLTRGLRADSDSWRTRKNLAKFLAQLERYPEAEAEIRKALDALSMDGGGYALLSRVLYAQGKYPEYAQRAERAVSAFDFFKNPQPEVREFLEKFKRWGPGAALPPAPDPPLMLGWSHD